MSGVGPVDRWRQARRLLGSEGASGVGLRMRVRLAERLVPPGTRSLPLSRADLLGLPTPTGGPPPPLPLAPGEPMTVSWVCAPPAAGSGGHTTIFRMVAALEAAGHRCLLHLDDRHGWSLDQHREGLRAHWPEVRAEVRDVAEGIEDSHAIIATSWPTAYAVRGSRARGSRLYFVQDFEPLFYPAGSEYLLAEATYRFGFHGVTAGPWLAEKLTRDYGRAADHFDFGCDLDAYALDVRTPARDGVAYYCRPGTPRRAHELAVLALDLFHRRYPQVPIHLYGQAVGGLPFPARQHGLLDPRQLSDLYNRCLGGLVLSATNVSLVPWEMLAAGCIPVVNDAEHNRRVLDNDHVRYAAATPGGLADALGRLARTPSALRHRRAIEAARSVVGASWADAGATVEGVIRHVVESRPLCA